MDNLEKVIEVDENEKQIVEHNEDIKEGLVASGLYFKEEDGTQGFYPRAKREDQFKLDMEQELQREKWTKELMKEYPNVDESTIFFMVGFYLKDPKDYERIVKEKKGTPSRYDETIFELTKKYGKSQEQNDKDNNAFYESMKNFQGLELFNEDINYNIEDKNYNI